MGGVAGASRVTALPTDAYKKSVGATHTVATRPCNALPSLEGLMAIYLRSESVVFCKVNEPYGGFSNMAPGFPLWFEGLDYRTSEHLYQSLRFPQHPLVQERIRNNPSPMGAKMSTRPFRATHSRSDWEEICVEVMRFCLRLKLNSYRTSFGGLLLSTGDKPIVEESRRNRSDPWSARAKGRDILEGENGLGVLLMELREELKGIPAHEPIPVPMLP